MYQSPSFLGTVDCIYRPFWRVTFISCLGWSFYVDLANLPCIQLFRERLSEKLYATILKGIVGGFQFTVLQRNLKELARKAMKMCLRVLTERNKVGSTATVVRNSISIISHITFRDCRVHSFSDNFSRNSCM